MPAPIHMFVREPEACRIVREALNILSLLIIDMQLADRNCAARPSVTGIKPRDQRRRTVDEVYRGYRIAVSLKGGRYEARISSVRGPALQERPLATEAEGAEACSQLARAAVDRYISFLDDV